MKKYLLIFLILFFAFTVNAAGLNLGNIGLSTSIFSIPQTEEHYEAFRFFNPMIYNVNGALFSSSLGLNVELGYSIWNSAILSGTFIAEGIIDLDFIVPMSHMYYIHPGVGLLLELQFFQSAFSLGFGGGYGTYFDIAGTHFPGYYLKSAIIYDQKESRYKYGFSFEYNQDGRMRFRISAVRSIF